MDASSGQLQNAVEFIFPSVHRDVGKSAFCKGFSAFVSGLAVIGFCSFGVRLETALPFLLDDKQSVMLVGKDGEWCLLLYFLVSLLLSSPGSWLIDLFNICILSTYVHYSTLI